MRRKPPCTVAIPIFGTKPLIGWQMLSGVQMPPLSSTGFGIWIKSGLQTISVNIHTFIFFMDMYLRCTPERTHSCERRLVKDWLETGLVWLPSTGNIQVLLNRHSYAVYCRGFTLPLSTTAIGITLVGTIADNLIQPQGNTCSSFDNFRVCKCLVCGWWTTPVPN